VLRHIYMSLGFRRLSLCYQYTWEKRGKKIFLSPQQLLCVETVNIDTLAGNQPL